MAFKDSTDEKFQDQINGSKLNLIQFSASWYNHASRNIEGAGKCRGKDKCPSCGGKSASHKRTIVVDPQK